MSFSPFDQFEINPLLNLGNFSITNFSIYLFLTFFIIVFLFRNITTNLRVIPTPFQTMVESLYSFLFNLVIEQAGPKGQRFFPILFSTFIFILIANLLGMTPFGFTITAHISLTFFMSLSFFIAWILVGLIHLKLQFFRIFLPRGIPGWLIPLLVVIEILSFCIRPISLAVRLFANMLAGHILLYILGNATIVLSNSFIILGVFPFGFIFAFFILELGIAFLQAYVFTILLAIYLSDSFNQH